ncbi:phage NrS-1 polymerase family protein [Rubrivivax albus]|uniref:NrS-1 polymerase-like HBD domain-containing protein n=1 Tax=Rubrivivax albus TaxID=2499835 RepID=A0A437JRY6_9BURK|nr:hypothetical protein [Rubrivivax albus]RVT49649.1 hypothetical protein ENE75_18560 [Rubrivivax albus]
MSLHELRTSAQGSPLPDHPLGPLAPLAEWHQFIVATIEPGTNGKTDKIPRHWITGEVCNAHEPANWTTYDAAATMAATRGARWAVGFVITAADPWMCIDLDHVLQADGTWHPAAVELVQSLPGAVTERSQSGQGMHVWCRYPDPPTHRKRRRDLAIDLECYSAARFIMLGTGQVGTLAPRCDALPAVLARYFEPAAAPDAQAHGDGPRADWSGPTDDDELIRRALQSRSAGAAFGGKASFADLWNRNVDALSRTYKGTDEGGVDWSSADAGLAQHLAWWTGANQARMIALMQRSALVRDKWDNREDYLPRTVANACAKQRDVLQDRPPERPPALTIEDATRQMIGVKRDEALIVWRTAAPQLSPTDREAFLTTAEAVTGMGRRALNAELREVMRADSLQREHAAFEAGLGGRVAIEHEKGNATSQADLIERAIVQHCAPGAYVRFGGKLSQVTAAELPYTHAIDKPDGTPPDVPVIKALTRAELRAHVEARVRFYETTRGGHRKFLDVPPVILDALADRHTSACPRVSGLLAHPLVLPSGEILSGAGLHATGLFLAGAQVPGLRAFNQAEAGAALAWLREVHLEGFEFASDLDRDIALAALLTGVQRRVLPMAPGVAILANTQSSGKTTLARRLHVTLTGRDMPVSTFALGNEDEVQKALLAMLMRSPAMVCFDNVPDGYTFQSGSLAAALTASEVNQRLLGGNETVAVPTNVLFALTGNNLSLGNDEVTRWLVVRLAPKHARPEERRFKHADVVGHAIQLRAEVLRHVVGIVAGYLTSDARLQLADGTRYARWDEMVRQPLLWAGAHDVAQVFRANAEQSEPVRAHRALVARLCEAFPDGAEFSAAQIADLASRAFPAPDPDLREAIEALGARDHRSPRSVGRVLKAKVGKAVDLGGHHMRIVAAPEDRNGVGRYRLDRVG